MNMRQRIEDSLGASASLKLLLRERQTGVIEAIGRRLVETFSSGHRLYLFGNGGSAADAQHIAAELEGRFLRERRALPAIALTTNTSTLTAIANDSGFERTFARQVEALVQSGDAVIAISTSGRSPNVLEGVRQARAAGAVTIGFTNEDGGDLRALVDLCLCVPSTDTARVQECHLTVGHILCELIEAALFG